MYNGWDIVSYGHLDDHLGHRIKYEKKYGKGRKATITLNHDLSFTCRFFYFWIFNTGSMDAFSLAEAQRICDNQMGIKT